MNNNLSLFKKLLIVALIIGIAALGIIGYQKISKKIALEKTRQQVAASCC